MVSLVKLRKKTSPRPRGSQDPEPCASTTSESPQPSPRQAPDGMSPPRSEMKGRVQGHSLSLTHRWLSSSITASGLAESQDAGMTKSVEVRSVQQTHQTGSQQSTLPTVRIEIGSGHFSCMTSYVLGNVPRLAEQGRNNLGINTILGAISHSTNIKKKAHQTKTALSPRNREVNGGIVVVDGREMSGLRIRREVLPVPLQRSSGVLFPPRLFSLSLLRYLTKLLE